MQATKQHSLGAVGAAIVCVQPKSLRESIAVNSNSRSRLTGVSNQNSYFQRNTIIMFIKHLKASGKVC